MFSVFGPVHHSLDILSLQVEEEQQQEDQEATPKRAGRRGQQKAAAASEDPGEDILKLHLNPTREKVSKIH